MLFKALVLAILIYYALRAAGSLYRAVQGDRGRQERMDAPRRRGGQERATRDRHRQDIEDATWEDL